MFNPIGVLAELDNLARVDLSLLLSKDICIHYRSFFLKGTG